MSGDALLAFARGPGLELAVALFLFGLLLRLIEILALGRKVDLAPRRRRPGASGGWTVVRRLAPPRERNRRTLITYLLGYTFHIGLFITLLLFAPHIELFRATLGLSWPALTTPLVDLAAVVTMAALIGSLINRLTDPVKRFLGGLDDYLAWALTFLPVVTGYLAFHHLLLPYATMLALHILSAELLLALLPLTRLVHAVTTWPARWYTGEIAGRKGVKT